MYDIIERWRQGDHINDTELEAAISLYRTTIRNFEMLGDMCPSTMRELRRELTALETSQRWRKNSLTSTTTITV